MRLTIDRDDLLAVLSEPAAIVDQRKTMPILGNLLLVVENDGLSGTGSDADMEVTVRRAAVVTESGTLCADAASMRDWARRLDRGATVEMIARDGYLTMVAGRRRLKLQTLPAEDFPRISAAAGDGLACAEIEAGSLRRVLDRTLFAVSTEETRYYLNGVYMHPTERDGVPVLRVAATDGHRLGLADTVAPSWTGDPVGAIIPTKAATAMRRIAGSWPGALTLGLGETKCSLHGERDGGSIYLLSKVVDGEFPDYGRVIPEPVDRGVTVDAAALAAEVDAICAADFGMKSRGVGVTPGDDGLALAFAAPSNAGGCDGVIADARMFGKPQAIGFNAAYLADMCGAMGGTLTITWGDPTTPALVRTDADASALGVIMPLRLEGKP